jgi:hypothetical protein
MEVLIGDQIGQIHSIKAIYDDYRGSYLIYRTCHSKGYSKEGVGAAVSVVSLGAGLGPGAAVPGP